METWSVRRRTDRDLDGCADVLATVHEREGYPVNWPARPTDWLAPPTLLTAWVAEWDGRVVGHVGLCRADGSDVAARLWSDREGVGIEATAVVSRLFVAPSAHGRGIGAALMARAVAEARERALRPVLDVVASDTAAVALYERLGWELLGTAEQRWTPARTVSVRCYAL
ncbi:GNAT family N-acetyltransferase [Streptomyces sp. NPDC047928]|uniref:GNAT family N-acetyltransferase n=1 Tax=unclassified Streptomyces TaxID=2593676 RepID=UPI0037163B04